jgi:hypothetical protein
MHTLARNAMLKLAPSAGSIGQIVASVNEGGIVSPRLLEQALTEAGYKVIHEKLKVRYRVSIFKSQSLPDLDTNEPIVPQLGQHEPLPLLVAHGISDSPEDALLQAVYGAIKEESTAKEN